MTATKARSNHDYAIIWVANLFYPGPTPFTPLSPPCQTTHRKQPAIQEHWPTSPTRFESAHQPSWNSPGQVPLGILTARALYYCASTTTSTSILQCNALCKQYWGCICVVVQKRGENLLHMERANAKDIELKLLRKDRNVGSIRGPRAFGMCVDSEQPNASSSTSALLSVHLSLHFIHSHLQMHISVHSLSCNMLSPCRAQLLWFHFFFPPSLSYID